MAKADRRESLKQPALIREEKGWDSCNNDATVDVQCSQVSSDEAQSCTQEWGHGRIITLTSISDAVAYNMFNVPTNSMHGRR